MTTSALVKVSGRRPSETSPHGRGRRLETFTKPDIQRMRARPEMLARKGVSEQLLMQVSRRNWSELRPYEFQSVVSSSATPVALSI
jgi:hypothetical protein